MIKTLVVGFSFVGLATMVVLNHTSERYSYVEKNLPSLGTPAVGEQKEETLDPMIYLTDSKKNFFCSGFVIDNNYAITAGHCVTDKVGQVIYADDLPIHVAGVNMRLDYALLKGSFTQFKKFQVALFDPLSELLTGTTVLTCGYPMGQHQPVCTNMRVIGQRGFQLAGHGELYPGMSGGPVIEPVTGTVVGVNSAVDFDEHPENFDLVYVSRLTGLAGNFKIERK